MEIFEHVIEELTRSMGQLRERLATAATNARRRRQQLIADLQQQINDVIGEMRRWAAKQQRRTRANGPRQPDKRTRAAIVTLFDKLPADVAMSPPALCAEVAKRTATTAAFATLPGAVLGYRTKYEVREAAAAAATAFAELPGDDAQLELINPRKRVRIPALGSFDVYGATGSSDIVPLDAPEPAGDPEPELTGSSDIVPLDAPEPAREPAPELMGSSDTFPLDAPEPAHQPAPEVEAKTQHHRRQSSLVGDAVGAVVGFTGAAIGNTTGAVVGGVGAIAGGLCRFVFGGKNNDKKQETRGRSATRSLSPRGRLSAAASRPATKPLCRYMFGQWGLCGDETPPQPGQLWAAAAAFAELPGDDARLDPVNPCKRVRITRMPAYIGGSSDIVQLHAPEPAREPEPELIGSSETFPLDVPEPAHEPEPQLEVVLRLGL
ncbi:hypothetical protein JKP88DRAFT_274616 [Tribonema minus]|uniref:Uncharacterized protein n=1 Tax=Tribonema minus TaxID=303371 RepID=A0A836C8V1_9STRA|nr:hypothetical protein JKP88DRAFT_274616 [Tribonema minus]